MTDTTLRSRGKLPGTSQIEPMLVASTAHVTEAEARAIDEGTHVCEPSMTRDVGWLFHVRSMCLEGPAAEGRMPLSTGFERLAARAVALGCPWLLLDRDAETIEDIPWHTW